MWIVAAILFAVWVLGLALKVTTGLVHVALVAAVVLFVLDVFRRRPPTTVGS
ncbi:MAG TPA: lmo0937 family membrane protein [Anaeromyxobacteraceae bacterium]|nr:lmo0937 family membrane protein [Anaeromyxobacteraceae bacterium]